MYLRVCIHFSSDGDDPDDADDRENRPDLLQHEDKIKQQMKTQL